MQPSSYLHKSQLRVSLHVVHGLVHKVRAGGEVRIKDGHVPDAVTWKGGGGARVRVWVMGGLVLEWRIGTVRLGMGRCRG